MQQLVLKTYPKNDYLFRKWLLSNNKFIDIYNKLGIPKLFDVSLRDGLQALPIDEQNQYTFDSKKELYKNIYYAYKPINIEIGSIVSKKILPIMENSKELFNYVHNHQLQKIKTNNYLLIPNKYNLFKLIYDNKYKNFSFITSVSNSFQKKNTKKTLDENIEEIEKMFHLIDYNYNNDYKIKLYISCINECPIEGKINNDIVINEILKYKKYNIENICLSDTCGTLDIVDFEYIIDKCNTLGIPYSNFSLHLHVKDDRKDIVKKIIHKAFDKKIMNFDVSVLKSGGCSVTIDNNKLLPNLSYELFYESLVDYIENNINHL